MVQEMIVRTLKLKLTKSQEVTLDGWLWNLTGVWNFAIRKIELDARDKVYHSQNYLRNLLSNHSSRLGIPSHTLQGMLSQAYLAWQRCFQKKAKKPRLKGNRNKLNSIPFPDPLRPPKDNRIAIPGLGKVRCYKQDLPEVRIKCGRIVKRASGWYFCLWIDTVHSFLVQDTDKAVGIDPGFDTLLTLSDGTKIENPRELRKGAARLAQSQREHDKKLTARLLDRQANRRRDRNHKISRKLVEENKTIYYSDDNFKGMARRFGKSVTEAGLNQLIAMMNYKGTASGREVIPVNSFRTTMTCSACGALSGPTGSSGLAVRNWECSACGAVHDRDINSAVTVLNTGLGISHERRLSNAA
jgi:putative transposase